MSSLFGVGTDLVEVQRMAQVIERFGDRFLNRIFHVEEQRYVQSKTHQAVHWAVRFCAKEAFFKALGTGIANGFRFADVFVLKDGQGRPYLSYSAKLQQELGRQGILRAQVSLSHTHDYALATVILELA